MLNKNFKGRKKFVANILILNYVTLSLRYRTEVKTYILYYWLYYSYLSCYSIFSTTTEFNSTGISLSYKHKLTHSSRKNIFLYLTRDLINTQV